MKHRKAFWLALAAALALAAVYFLWQRGWVLRQPRAVLVLTADSLTMGGVVTLAVGLLLRGRQSKRPLFWTGRKASTELPPDLTQEDVERMRQTRRATGSAAALAGGLVLALALLLNLLYVFAV